MARLRKIYLDELARIQERVNSLFDQALLGAGLADREDGPPGTWSPAVDIVEGEAAYLLYAELPGVRREDIDLSVVDRRLELSGRRQPLAENRSFLRMERSYGPFRRIFDLGAPLDPEAVSARFEHGILMVTLPKRGGR